ncbi:MAG TPA: hypothetical protein VGX03_11895 [Candidatus Binatia bacterium]|nr:hypothetical protein [Candidatus Binatia bacterium]
MANVSPDKLRELFPEPWWSGYRAGRAEALADPALRKQIAEEYLRENLTKPGAASPA